MKIPLSWLRDYLNLTISPAELVERLTLAGLEVSATQVFGLPIPDGLRVKAEDRGPVWDRDKVVVGHVQSVEKHPNADKLKLVHLNYGAAEPKVVVTGAPNIRIGDQGQYVVVGLTGSSYWDTHVTPPAIKQLKPTKLRGVPSDSMVMSNTELGTPEDLDGIIILDEAVAPGTPFVDVAGDIVIEVDVLPNMARCLAMIGVAREVAAITGQRIHLPTTTLNAASERIDGKVTVTIDDAKLSARYMALLIRDVTIGPAPGWMGRRLRYAGQRSISNIVDITNYVMLETGQPLHAFDYDVLVQRAGGKTPAITVRAARAGEKLRTLDNVERELTPDMLVIADAVGPIALAGVMGGLETEVTATTKNILLESASFDFVSIRRTSKHLNLISEASMRFSKGIHPEVVPFAAQRAAYLMQQYAGGTVLAGAVDTYPAPIPTQTITLRRSEIRRILGIDLANEEVERILGGLEFGVKPVGDGWEVTTPPHRLDIQAGAADLIEDLARLHGYDHLPTTLLASQLPQQRSQVSLENEERVRDLLTGLGLEEAITYALTAPAREAKLGSERAGHVTLLNPLMADRAVMRQTLLPGLLEVAAENLKHLDTVQMFEVGFVYLPKAGHHLPDEPRRLAIVLSGRRAPAAWDDPLGNKPPMLDFFDLKGIIESLLKDMHISGIRYQANRAVPFLHPGRCADVVLGEQVVGQFGELHPKTAEKFEFKDRAVLVAELDLESLIAAVPVKYPYHPISTFPAALRDVAIIVAEEVANEQVERIFCKAGTLLRGARLFDVYRGANLPPNTKSLAYALTYQAADRTLADTEIDAAHQAVEAMLRTELKALIRGKDGH